MSFAANEAGLPVPTDDAVASIIGLSLEQAVAELFPDADLAVLVQIALAYRTEALRLRAEAEDSEVLFPGVRKMVEQLRGYGHILGIATGKALCSVMHFYQRFDMVGWFGTVQTPDTNPGKPHPGMIESAISEAGARRRRTLMVGDTTFDMEMARNAGVPCIWVSWGNHPATALERAGARHIVKTADALPQAIAHILKEEAHK